MQKKITAKADPNPAHANGCMYGMQKWMLANACGYLQERYAFCNIQHAKKNLLTALHDASASHREKCIKLPKYMPLSHTLQNGCQNTCTVGEGISASLYIRVCKMHMHAHMHGRLGSA
jgi:hypothetical protein